MNCSRGGRCAGAKIRLVDGLEKNRGVSLKNRDGPLTRKRHLRGDYEGREVREGGKREAKSPSADRALNRANSRQNHLRSESILRVLRVLRSEPPNELGSGKKNPLVSLTAEGARIPLGRWKLNVERWTLFQRSSRLIIASSTRLIVPCTLRIVPDTSLILRAIRRIELNTSLNARAPSLIVFNVPLIVADTSLLVREIPFFEFKRRLLAIKHRLL
jgi:hypothetical protein